MSLESPDAGWWQVFWEHFEPRLQGRHVTADWLKGVKKLVEHQVQRRWDSGAEEVERDGARAGVAEAGAEYVEEALQIGEWRHRRTRPERRQAIREGFRAQFRDWLEGHALARLLHVAGEGGGAGEVQSEFLAERVADRVFGEQGFERFAQSYDPAKLGKVHGLLKRRIIWRMSDLIEAGLDEVPVGGSEDDDGADGTEGLGSLSVGGGVDLEDLLGSLMAEASRVDSDEAELLAAVLELWWLSDRHPDTYRSSTKRLLAEAARKAGVSPAATMRALTEEHERKREELNDWQAAQWARLRRRNRLEARVEFARQRVQAEPKARGRMASVEAAVLLSSVGELRARRAGKPVGSGAWLGAEWEWALLLKRRALARKRLEKAEAALASYEHRARSWMRSLAEIEEALGGGGGGAGSRKPREGEFSPAFWMRSQAEIGRALGRSQPTISRRFARVTEFAAAYFQRAIEARNHES